MYENQETRYTYAIERPHPPKKKKNTGLFALILSCALISGAVGGAAGYSISQLSLNAAEPARQEQNAEWPEEASSWENTITPVVKAPSGSELTLEQVFEKCNPAVVAISTELQTRNFFGQFSLQPSAGSGFIISANGYVATNYHVIEGASGIQVMLPNGKEYDAKVVGSDAPNDIAVLKIEAAGLPYLEFGSSETMKVGNTVAAIGNPLGELANSFTSGVLSAKGRSINVDGNPMILLQTDASVSPGNSGGPLLNLYGQVIGIISAKSQGDGVEGLGFAIPGETAESVINELIEHGYVTNRPYLGVSIQELDASMARYYGLAQGLYVASVEKGSCAEKAGIQEGDIMIGLGKTDLTTLAEWKTEKMKYKAGDTVEIKISRDGKTMTLKVTFDEEKPTVTTTSSSSGNRWQTTEGV